MRPLRLFLERCFAGASELSEPVSSLWAIGAVVSELSDVELLSPLPSSGRWSGPCLLCGRWSLEPALRNDVRRDIICWRLPDVSRLFFIKYCRRASFGSRLMLLGDGAANLRRDASGRRRIGVVTSFFATLPMLQSGLATLAVLEPAFFTPGETLTNGCKLRYWLRIDHVLTRCSSACVRQLPHLSINDHLPTKCCFRH